MRQNSRVYKRLRNFLGVYRKFSQRDRTGWMERVERERGGGGDHQRNDSNATRGGNELACSGSQQTRLGLARFS